jgi:hypothetical protein
MLAGDGALPDYRPPSRRGKGLPSRLSTPSDSPTKSALGSSQQEGSAADGQPTPQLTDLPLQAGLEKEHSAKRDGQ